MAAGGWEWAVVVVAVMREVVGRVRAWDVAMAMVGLFLFSCVAHRVTQKGPLHWPVFGVIPTLFLHMDNVYEWATAYLDSAGGTFPYRGMWMGGAHGVMTSDPANVEYVLRTRFANFPKGPYYRERFADLLGDGIFNADDSAWRLQRRAATSQMHSPRFVSYSASSISSLLHGKLLPLLSRLSPAPADLQDLLLRFTFDNICSAAFGVDPGCLAADVDHLPEVPFARAFERATELTLIRFMVPPFVWKPMRLLGVGTERELKEAVRVVHQFAEKTVADRRAEFAASGGNLRDRSDLLSRLVEAKEDEDEDDGGGKLRFSDKFIQDFCISFILAGRDTSSVALAWFFWLLHGRPDVETRILDELHATIRRRGSQGEQEEEVVFTAEEVGGMDYLQAALSEALRLYPSVPVDFKEAVEDDVLPDGSPVRKGGRVIYSIYSMGRAVGVWGKDCREFRPERWIGDGGRFECESQFKYPVFNAGPRLCIGKKFAYVQMKMVAAAVLLRYRVNVVDGQVVEPKITTTLYMKNGLLVTFIPRAQKKIGGGGTPQPPPPPTCTTTTAP